LVVTSKMGMASAAVVAAGPDGVATPCPATTHLVLYPPAPAAWAAAAWRRTVQRKMKTAVTVILAWLLVACGPAHVGAQSFSESGARQRFERRFNETCSKYPFVQQYVENLAAPTRRYVIFVFHENGGLNGGLGDRLGGMVSAVAFALRTGRTLLISGDKAFEEAFQPFHPDLLLSHPPRPPKPHKPRRWSSWDWAGWRREYAGNLTYLRQCVNPRPTATVCHLDRDLPQRVVKYRSNRAFLCRWVIKPAVYRTSGLARLGITATTDLFEAAGCMLRLAMWPTERLWRALDKSLEPQLRQQQVRQGLPVTAAVTTTYQVGFHFRCGDTSFDKKGNNAGGGSGMKKKKNPECFFDPSVPWKGTNFMDDKSLDSPVDAAACGRKILHSLPAAVQRHAMTYIASDNPDSSQQINGTMQWPFVVLPPKGCHVDLHASFECTLTTSLHWFMLSLSDQIVMQGLIKPEVGAGSLFEDLPPEDGSPRPTKHLTGAISGFSRFASIYSLAADVTRYGLTCEPIDKGALAKQTQGNWLCNPKQLY